MQRFAPGFENEPDGHGVHAEEPSRPEKVPRAQMVHNRAAAAEYSPAAQFAHEAEVVPDADGLDVPAEQPVHATELNLS